MDILVADDEDDIREQVCAVLEDEGYQARPCATVEAALAEVEDRLPAMAILDVWFQESARDGLLLLEEIKTRHPRIPVMMVSGHSTVDMAVRALKHGACDFLTKPFSLESLLHAVERGLEEANLRRENEEMTRQLGRNSFVADFPSPAMAAVRKNIESWAATDRRLLVTGAFGTGKGALVEYIHRHSRRARGSLQRHHCARFVDDDHQRKMLFGVEGGQIGKCEIAHRGTLVLENVEQLSPALQKDVSQFLLGHQFVRLGGHKAVEVDVRVIGSSSLSAQQIKEQTGFQSNLYDSLALGVVALPQLDQRLEDLPLLIQMISERLSVRYEMPCPRLCPEVLSMLERHHWKGNLDELEQVLGRILFLGKEVTVEKVGQAISDHQDSAVQHQEALWQRLVSSLSPNLREARDEFDRHFLQYFLDRNGGNVSRTAREIDLDRASLHRKIRSLKIGASVLDDDSSG